MSNTIYWADNDAAPSFYQLAYSTEKHGVYTSLTETANTSYVHATGEYDDWYKLRTEYISGTSDWTQPFQSIVDEGNMHCIVYGNIRQVNMRFTEDMVQEVSASPIRVPANHLDWGLNIQKVETADVNTQGYFQVMLTKHTPVKLEIPCIGYAEEVMVPSASSTDFRFLSPYNYRG